MTHRERLHTTAHIKQAYTLAQLGLGAAGATGLATGAGAGIGALFGNEDNSAARGALTGAGTVGGAYLGMGAGVLGTLAALARKRRIPLRSLFSSKKLLRESARDRLGTALVDFGPNKLTNVVAPSALAGSLAGGVGGYNLLSKPEPDPSLWQKLTKQSSTWEDLKHSLGKGTGTTIMSNLAHTAVSPGYSSPRGQLSDKLIRSLINSAGYGLAGAGVGAAVDSKDRGRGARRGALIGAAGGLVADDLRTLLAKGQVGLIRPFLESR